MKAANKPLGFTLSATWTAEPSSLLPGGLAEVLAGQHLQIFQSLVTGEAVLFLNSDGQTESLTFVGGPRAQQYTIEGDEGSRLVVSSRLSDEQTMPALCKIADIFSRIPVEFRYALRAIEIGDESRSGGYLPESGKLRIFGGLKAIDERAFAHIFG